MQKKIISVALAVFLLFLAPTSFSIEPPESIIEDFTVGIGLDNKCCEMSSLEYRIEIIDPVTFVNSEIDLENIELLNPPHGLKLEFVERSSQNRSWCNLYFSPYTDPSAASCTEEHRYFGITIDGSEISSGRTLTNNNITIKSNNWVSPNSPAIIGSGSIPEGQENGAKLYFEIRHGTFNEEALDTHSWKFNTLPYGVVPDFVELTDDTHAVVTLKGKSVQDYDVDFGDRHTLGLPPFELRYWACYLDQNLNDFDINYYYESPPFIANDDDESITAEAVEEIKLGEEDGKQILITIEGGYFLDFPYEFKQFPLENGKIPDYVDQSEFPDPNYGIGDWSLIDAPDGVSIGKVDFYYDVTPGEFFPPISSYSSSKALITLSGNATEYAENTKMKIRCPFNKYSDHRTQKSIPAWDLWNVNFGNGSRFDFSLISNEIAIHREPKITELEVIGGTLEPAFDPGIYEYIFTSTDKKGFNFSPYCNESDYLITWHGDVKYEYEKDENGKKTDVIKKSSISGKNFSIKVTDPETDKFAEYKFTVEGFNFNRGGGTVTTTGGGTSVVTQTKIGLPYIIKTDDSLWIYKFFNKTRNNSSINNWAYNLELSNPDVLKKADNDNLLAVSAGECEVKITDTADKKTYTAKVLVQGDLTANSNVDFTDIADHWGKQTILNIAKKGLMVGIGDNRFKPEGTVTIEEVITVLDRYLVDKSEPVFTNRDTNLEIKTSDWSKFNVRDFISRVGDEKLSFVFGNDIDFTQTITREQTTYLMSLAYFADSELPEITANQIGYTDSLYFGDKFLPYIALMKNKGVMTGNPDNTFEPQNSLTRAEFATILTRLR